MAHAGGRPPKYKNARDMQKKIDEYFANPEYRTVTTKTGELVEIPVYTITGLVLYLGFCDRRSFYDLEKQEKFSHTIKMARTRIENEYEKMLNNVSCTGAIFALKNLGWADKQEVIATNANVNVTDEKTINDVIEKLKCL